MTKNYEMNEFDTSTLAVPEQVRVAMGEIAADLREGLAVAVGAGLRVMAQLMVANVVFGGEGGVRLTGDRTLPAP